jgi:hypothetical protein
MKKDYTQQLSEFIAARSTRVGERRKDEKKRVDKKRELMKRIREEEGKV